MAEPVQTADVGVQKLATTNTVYATQIIEYILVATNRGPDTATGKWSLNFRTILLATRSVTRLAVEYEDVYRKQDGRWYIAETRSTVTSMFTEVVGEDGSPKYVAFGEVPASVPEPA